jgi:transcriptional regulator with XRE-family HTH domain
MQKLMQHLGETLHLARRRAGKTIRELEKETGVSPTIISRVETGQRPQVSFEVIARLAKALNVSLDRVIAECAEEQEEELQPASTAMVGA